ncbi:MAG TPA: hypothetical protein VFI02_08460 [Armatimonadota bacterium]|nr:hypothetical protein [Armatimonadota bacterium]
MVNRLSRIELIETYAKMLRKEAQNDQEAVRLLINYLFPNMSQPPDSDESRDQMIDTIATLLSAWVQKGSTTDICYTMEALRQLMPEHKCSLHQERMDQSFSSFKEFVVNNAKCAWILPPLGQLDETPRRVKDLYLGLTLNEWSNLVVQAQDGHPALLDLTQYLFITWDLSKKDRWYEQDEDDELLSSLARMLTILKNKTANGEMFCHRIIILDWPKMNTNNKRHFLQKIWNPLIQSFDENGTPVDNPCYKVLFVDIEDLDGYPLGDGKTKEHRQGATLLRKDTALFSFDPTVRESADARKTVLPPPDGGTTIMDEYSAMQYSKLQHEMLLLFLLVGSNSWALDPSCQDGKKYWYHKGEVIADKEIRQKREQMSLPASEMKDGGVWQEKDTAIRESLGINIQHNSWYH